METSRKIVTPPAEEPITTAEAKNHIRVDITDDDTLIDSLVTTARKYVELWARRALITQTWRLNLGSWPWESFLCLPLPPLQSVDSITYTDKDGTPTVFSSDDYTVNTDTEPGQIELVYGATWPAVGAPLRVTNPIVIQFVVGYGLATAVPENYKQAILLLVGHWYENRELAVTTGAVPKEIPMAVEALVTIDRVF